MSAVRNEIPSQPQTRFGKMEGLENCQTWQATLSQVASPPSYSSAADLISFHYHEGNGLHQNVASMRRMTALKEKWTGWFHHCVFGIELHVNATNDASRPRATMAIVRVSPEPAGGV
jgi:23S rRNA A1618 N6-methylase RlmF